jgi:hypothetical protein
MGVIGVPIYPGGAIKHLQVPEPPIYVKMVGLLVLSVLTMHTKPPPYDFLNLYGAYLQAPRIPKNEVLDNLPRYGS